MKKEVKVGDILKNMMKKLVPMYIVRKVEPKYRPPLAYVDCIDKKDDIVHTYVWLNDDLSVPRGYRKVNV